MLEKKILKPISVPVLNSIYLISSINHLLDFSGTEITALGSLNVKRIKIHNMYYNMNVTFIT